MTPAEISKEKNAKVYDTLRACMIEEVDIDLRIDGLRVWPVINGERNGRSIGVAQEGLSFATTSQMTSGYQRVGMVDLWRWMCGEAI